MAAGQVCLPKVEFDFNMLMAASRIFPEVLSGQKRICLAITEPDAGSDVRNITTTAEKTADGKHYIVNGEKKMSALCFCLCDLKLTLHLLDNKWHVQQLLCKCSSIW